MEFFEKIYLQILNLILDLLTAFGADTEVVKGMIDDFNSAKNDNAEA